MRCPAWSFPIGACLLVAAIAGCKSSRPASAATTADPWQGEWALVTAGKSGGHIAIRDCVGEGKRCTMRLQTWGQKADQPARSGGCDYGGTSLSSSSEGNPPVLTTAGNTATLAFASLWDKTKTCQLALRLAAAAQPPRLHADLQGSGCGSFCSGDTTHFPAVFTLRSRKPYLQTPTYRRGDLCNADDTAAVQEWCTSDELFALRQTWKLRRKQLQANTGADAGPERDLWEEGMLDGCKAATPPGRCFADAYQQQLRELDSLVYAHLLDRKFTGAQVLSALYAGFDPRTAKTGRKTEVNAKGDGSLGDELVVFFKIAEVPFLPGHLLVLDVVSNGFEGYKAKGFFSVVKVEGGRLAVVAREPVGDPSDPLLTWYDERAGSKLKFDLANYRINDRERAFGYRLATWDGGTGASYGTESLLLFRLTPEGLRRVLDVDMESDDAAWDNQEGKVYKDKKQRFVLIVGSNQHEGNYDWILKGRLINKRIKRSRALRGLTYVWKNGEYVPAAD